MKLVVSFTGATPNRNAAIRERAVALLTAMEQEFAHLTVEVSDAKAPSPKAGKDGKLAGASR